MLNMNFDKRVVIDTHQQPWLASPHSGVWRKPLAREDAEKGHATSLVKFEPGASFSEHCHPLGEEIFVLSGTFSDHSGNYHAGSYFRNPEGFQHAPFSKDGCVLLVKLHQFQTGDNEHVIIETNKATWLPGIGGLKVMPLQSYLGESTALVKWPKGERFKPHQHFGGEEIFVISGKFNDEHGHYPQGTWIRSPHLSKHFPYVEEETVILVKVGHL